MDRPPLGLKPRQLAEEQRIIEISAALIRYAKVGQKIPIPWIWELMTLTESQNVNIEHPGKYSITDIEV